MRIGGEADMLSDFPVFFDYSLRLFVFSFPLVGNGTIGNEKEGFYIFRKM